MRTHCWHLNSASLYRYFYEQTVWPRPRSAWRALITNLATLLCITQILILNGRQVICTLCQGVTICNG